MLIGEPFADEPRKDAVGARHVIATKGNAVAVAEIELREIAVQMLLAAVLIDALHPAFEDAEKALNRVRVDAAASILADTMIDATVTLPFDALVNGVFVAQQPRFRRDIGADDRLNLVKRNALNLH